MANLYSLGLSKQNRIVSPTSVQQFADYSSDVTETTSNFSLISPLGRLQTEDAAGENVTAVAEKDDLLVHQTKRQSDQDASPVHLIAYNDIRDESQLQSKCCDYSSNCCGVSDEVQDLILHSAKWFCLRMPTIIGLRKLSENDAALMIQTRWRGYISTRHYQETMQSVLVYFELNDGDESEDQEDKSESASRLQKMWRGYISSKKMALAKSSAKKEQDASVLIQAHARRRIASAQYQKAKLFNCHPDQVAMAESAVICLQSYMRRYIAIQHIRQLKFKLLCILNQKHVDRSGSIEIILNESTVDTADETLTQYSDVSLDNLDEYSSCSADEDERRYQEQFSRCGLSDELHESLLETGKFVYDCVGDPVSDETAVDLLYIMEISEEFSGGVCCLRKSED